MPPSDRDRDLYISPIVPESLAHNAHVLTQIHSLTSSLLGLCAGILGLESLFGFAFYILGSLFVSFLIDIVVCGGRPGRYFGIEGGKGGRRHVYLKEMVGGLWGFGLAWAGGYGGVRAG
ncbi:MAG: hypothetical protein M1834_002821 [Cirrosporium novae-zelandiae]|nr:MAG: hypothetical protein M1834_002821 [Cirrosporium novae-zelandiae]